MSNGDSIQALGLDVEGSVGIGVVLKTDYVNWSGIEDVQIRMQAFTEDGMLVDAGSVVVTWALPQGGFIGSRDPHASAGYVWLKTSTFGMVKEVDVELNFTLDIGSTMNVDVAVYAFYPVGEAVETTTLPNGDVTAPEGAPA